LNAEAAARPLRRRVLVNAGPAPVGGGREPCAWIGYDLLMKILHWIRHAAAPLLVGALSLAAGCRSVPGPSRVEDSALLASASSGAAVPTPSPAAPAVDRTYRMNPGDSIRLEVFREPDISGVFPLSESGTIQHPLLGKVTLAGLNVEQAQTTILDLLAARYLVDPKVVVTLERWAQRPVIVFGEVSSPGSYDIPPGERIHLLQLVARAGGFTDIASVDRVRVVRARDGAEETLRVRVSKLLKGGGEGDFELMPGDVVIVPRTIF
jgi:protein involved in polysaccharide export with SLBB domain